MNRMRALCHFLAFAVALFLLVVTSAAQKTTGDVEGTVTDASGGAVPRADVRAECTTTKLTRTATTSDAGNYRLAELPVCVYKVSVSAQGFKTSVREVQVSIGLVTPSDFTLQLGQRSETVTVEAAAPLIELTDKVNNYVDAQRIVDLPLNGRDFNSLLGITPGVQRQPGGGFLAVNISGARRTANNYLIDGMYNNDRYYGDSLVGQTGVVGVPATILPNDAIEEFTVQQTPSAEYGVKGGAAINVALKSGSNSFHGSGYYFGHWDATDAKNFFGTQVTPIKNHQYGGTFGGPFVKDRTFFFAVGEAQRNQTLAPFEIGAPTTGNIAQGKVIAAGALGIPVTGPFPGDALLAFYPTATHSKADGTPVVTAAIPNIADSELGLIKIDHKLAKDHQISGRYYYSDSLQSAPQFGYTIPPPGNPDLFNSVAPSRAQLVGLTWTYNIAPNKILESRFGMSRFSQILQPNNKIDPKSLGIDTGPLDPLDFGVPYVYAAYISYGYIGGVAGYPISTRPNQSYDQSQHFTWIKGKHTIKIGGNVQYAFTDSIRNRARSNLQVLDASDADHAVAQILALRFDRASRNFGSTVRHLHQTSLGLYVSDEWKVNRRLTLTLGLRYDISGALGESDNQGGNFDPNLGLVTLGPNSKRIYNIDTNNLGPRAGFAWDIFGNGKTALRGGYSLTYDIPNFGSIHAPRTAFWNGARAGAFTNPSQGDFSKRVQCVAPASDPRFCAQDLSSTNVTSCLDSGNPNSRFVCGGVGHLIYGANPTGNPPFNIFGVVPNLQTPMYHYYNFTLQREVFPNSVLTISYVGSLGRDLLMYRDLNARPIGCFVGGVQQRTGACARPFDAKFPGQFLSIVQLTNDSKSWYNSLQVSFRQRSWHGINTQYNFTWGKCIDYNSINRGNARNASPAQNPYNPAANKGPCDYDVPRNFNAGGTYDIPKAKFLRRFGEGWQIGTVATVLDGRPFTPLVGSRDRSGQDLNGNLRADCTAPPKYNPRDPNNYIGNPAAFKRPANNTIGTCGRNSLRGPGFAQWDMNLNKTTRITERVSLQFRWEVFNVLNRANFSDPVVTVGSLFGTISQTTDTAAGNPILAQGAPRNMQFVFKVKF